MEHQKYKHILLYEVMWVFDPVLSLIKIKIQQLLLIELIYLIDVFLLHGIKRIPII